MLQQGAPRSAGVSCMFTSMMSRLQHAEVTPPLMPASGRSQYLGWIRVYRMDCTGAASSCFHMFHPEQTVLHHHCYLQFQNQRRARAEGVGASCWTSQMTDDWHAPDHACHVALHATAAWRAQSAAFFAGFACCCPSTPCLACPCTGQPTSQRLKQHQYEGTSTAT